MELNVIIVDKDKNTMMINLMHDDFINTRREILKYWEKEDNRIRHKNLKELDLEIRKFISDIKKIQSK